MRTTGDATKIKYGSAATQGERIKFQDLQVAIKQPMEFKPDPRVELENAHDE